jgi:hypothetical protein
VILYCVGSFESYFAPYTQYVLHFQKDSSDLRIFPPFHKLVSGSYRSIQPMATNIDSENWRNFMERKIC